MDTVSNYTETLEKTVRDLLERQDDLIRTAFTCLLYTSDAADE